MTDMQIRLDLIQRGYLKPAPLPALKLVKSPRPLRSTKVQKEAK